MDRLGARAEPSGAMNHSIPPLLTFLVLWHNSLGTLSENPWARGSTLCQGHGILQPLFLRALLTIPPKLGPSVLVMGYCNIRLCYPTRYQKGVTPGP